MDEKLIIEMNGQRIVLNSLEELTEFVDVGEPLPEGLNMKVDKKQLKKINKADKKICKHLKKAAKLAKKFMGVTL